MNMYLAVLPMFKSFVLIFEQSELMCHRLHDEQTSLFRDFLACFVKQQHISGLSARQLKELDVSNVNLHHSTSTVFVGNAVEQLIAQSNKHSALAGDFRKEMKAAYVSAALYIQKKLPLNNTLLRCLSAIDPKAQGHSTTYSHLKKLSDFFPSVLSAQEKDTYLREVSRIQTDQTLPEVKEDVRLDHWWKEVMPQYPARLSKHA